jgi:hypothetical protein
MDRTDIINYYLSVRPVPTFYLEIGVRDPTANFDHIVATSKDGVDSDTKCKCNYKMTSDKFFEKNIIKYDVIFVDGDHFFEQGYKDVVNSLLSLRSDGIVIMHDCNPPTEMHQINTNGPWTGTVWKAFVKLRMERSDLKMFVIDVDYGVGVVDPFGKQQTFLCTENIYNYSVFAKHRKEALNLISEHEWIKVR